MTRPQLTKILHLNAEQGNWEARTEAYKKYGEGVLHQLTQQRVKMVHGFGKCL